MPESETQARPADPYVRFWMQGSTEVAMLNAADFRAAMIERDHALADLARVTAERDSLIERRHEVQRAADARYSEAMRELRDWHRWQEVRQQANESLKEPGIVYQSAYVQAVVTDLMAERDRAREERDAMAAVVKAARILKQPEARGVSVALGEYAVWGAVQPVLDALARLDAAQ